MSRPSVMVSLLEHLRLMRALKQKAQWNSGPFIELPQKTKKALVRLEQYELPDYIRERLQKRFPFKFMAQNEIDDCIIEFKKYMAILVINYGNGRGIPMVSELVDEVWHTFVLFTRDYHKFCKMLVGGYIHHIPNTGGDESDPREALNFYEHYNRYFGEMPPIWRYKIMESHITDNTLKGECNDYLSPTWRFRIGQVNFEEIDDALYRLIVKYELQQNQVVDKFCAGCSNAGGAGAGCGSASVSCAGGGGGCGGGGCGGGG